MTQTFTLANAKLVLEDEIVTGALTVKNGKITGIETGNHVPVGAEDCFGDYLAPGLIELHTDNLERHMRPRPGVDWPHDAAIVAHDAELASVGITTVFDALRVGSIHSDGRKNYGKYARTLADEILTLRRKGGLKISHHLHLRAEICSETLPEELAEFAPEDRVGIVSMMDHTPGQRQFTDVSKFKAYIQGKYAMPDAEFDEYTKFLRGLQDRLGTDHERATVDHAARLGATLASHDDTTAAQVATSAGYGIHLAEFPTTVEAAQANQRAGIANIMGAPNVVRGGSHSGNVAAAELAELDLLDILSSDYVPSSLMLAALQVGDMWGNLARGLGTVTHAPARAVGLLDRGVIEVGKRADLIRFSRFEHAPVLRGVWSEGRRVG